MSMLNVENVVTAYGQIVALKGVSMSIEQGDIVCLLGANGAGKSTLINTISGILRARTGRVMFNDVDITRLAPSKIVSAGIIQVPEGRGIFAQMSVYENLLMGAHHLKGSALTSDDVDAAYKRFPVLAKRRHQKAGVLSGGEQQMLALARALMAHPKLLLLDEPSMGLAPLMVDQVFSQIQTISATGVTILLVEQNARLALEVSNQAYVLQNGELVASGSSQELMQSELVQEAYLGAS